MRTALRDFLIAASVPLFVLLGCGTAMLILDPTPPPLQFTELDLPAARFGEPYAVTVLISGNYTPINMVSVTSGKLPQGLEMTKVSSVGSISGFTIAGTPASHGGYTFTVKAYTSGDAHTLAQKGEITYTLRVT